MNEDNELDRYISLTVVSMGAETVEVTRIPADATVAEAIYAAQEVRGYLTGPWPQEAWDNIGIFFRSHDGQLRKLSPVDMLSDAGVHSGNTLIYVPRVRNASWLEVVEFLGTAAGGGVVGNAAYDLLKSTIGSVAARWRTRRRSNQEPTLRKEEAVSIAQACVSLQFEIADPQQLTALSVQRDVSVSHRSDAWTVSLGISGTGVSDYEVWMQVPSSDPEEVRISIVPVNRNASTLDTRHSYYRRP